MTPGSSQRKKSLRFKFFFKFSAFHPLLLLSIKTLCFLTDSKNISEAHLKTSVLPEFITNLKTTFCLKGSINRQLLCESTMLH